MVLLGKDGDIEGLWHFKRFDNYVDKSVNWYSNLSGGGVFED